MQRIVPCCVCGTLSAAWLIERIESQELACESWQEAKGQDSKTQEDNQ